MTITNTHQQIDIELAEPNKELKKQTKNQRMYFMQTMDISNDNTEFGRRKSGICAMHAHRRENRTKKTCLLNKTKQILTDESNAQMRTRR